MIEGVASLTFAIDPVGYTVSPGDDLRHSIDLNSRCGPLVVIGSVNVRGETNEMSKM